MDNNNSKYKSLFNGEKRIKDFQKQAPLKIVPGYDANQLMQTHAVQSVSKGIANPNKR